MIKPYKTTLLDQCLSKKRFSLIEADVQTRQKLIETIYAKIAERQKRYVHDRLILESLAFQLHNLYCAFESLCKIIADHFENLKRFRIKAAKPDEAEHCRIRPAFISEPAFALLTELRDFRRLIRHEYQVKLEPAQIKIVLKKALKLKKSTQKKSALFSRD
jgi:hypothetical protein